MLTYERFADATLRLYETNNPHEKPVYLGCIWGTDDLEVRLAASTLWFKQFIVTMGGIEFPVLTSTARKIFSEANKVLGWASNKNINKDMVSQKYWKLLEDVRFLSQNPSAPSAIQAANELRKYVLGALWAMELELVR